MQNAISKLAHRKDSAILFADVAGYSRLMKKNENATYERVIASIDLMRQLIQDYRGRVVEVVGDGVYALFDNAKDALTFAVEVQREFRKEATWSVDGDPIAFRIGINFGSVLIDQTGARGHSVNVAARIQALARPGGICISGAARREIGTSISQRMRKLGLKNLKNIDEEVEIFSIEFNGDQYIEVPLASPIDIAIELPNQASVAILPFDNLSSNHSDDHLCSGMTGDITNSLCKFRDLFVIAHHSARHLKQDHLSTAEIGRRLGVRYLVQGTLQRSGARLRLNVALVESASNSLIWSDRYDGHLTDIFAFQDDVTSLITARLAIQISAAEGRRQASANTPDIRAYGLIVRGSDLNYRYKREANLHARRLFERAATIDPNYGRSYAGISRTFNLAWRYRWTESPEEALDQAVELAAKATSYDSLDARGYGALGFAYLYKKRHDECLAAYERAIELNPNDADLLAEMGDALAYSEQPERGVEMLERAIRLNPYHPDWYLWNLGDAHFYSGNYEGTISALKKMRDQSEAHRLLTSCYGHLGLLDEARYHAAQIFKTQPDFSIEFWRGVPPNKNARDNERFIEGLRTAGLK